jgi:hypothetical protein
VRRFKLVGHSCSHCHLRANSGSFAITVHFRMSSQSLRYLTTGPRPIGPLNFGPILDRLYRAGGAQESGEDEGEGGEGEHGRGRGEGDECGARAKVG